VRKTEIPKVVESWAMENTTLENAMGKTLSARAVADYLGLDVSVVRKHYTELGGVKIGRQYLFFENLIVEAIKGNPMPYWDKSKQKWRGTVLREATGNRSCSI